MEKAQVIRNTFSYIFIIVSISIIVIILYFTIKEHKRISQIDIMIAEKKEQYEEVTKNKKLAEKLVEYKKTTISKERDAHERGYYADGEKVVIIKTPKIADEKQKTHASEKYIIKQPILAWYNVFFGNK